MRVLCLSTIDLDNQKGGGAAYSKGVLEAFRGNPLCAEIKYLKSDGLICGSQRITRIFSAGRSLLSEIPAFVLYERSKKFSLELSEFLSHNEIDLILINYGATLWLLDQLPPEVPKILIAHNIEHHIYAERTKKFREKVPILGSYFESNLRKFQNFECSAFKNVDGVITISTDDMKFIRENSSGYPIICVPPMFDYVPFERPPPVDKQTLDLGYVSKLSWWPNREGLAWFVDKVLPGLPDNVRVHLFGLRSDKLKFSDRRVVAHGFVEDIQDVWKISDIMICPIFSGSGVNVKLAEGLFNGMPTLATSFAGRGLVLPETPGLVFLDTADEWVSFLSSEKATALRASHVAADVASHFDLRSHRRALAAFVAEVMARDANQPRGVMRGT